MQSLIPFLAVLCQAGSATIDKAGLSVRGVTVGRYLGVTYLLHFLLTLGALLVLRPQSSASFSGQMVLLLSASTALWLLANLVYYRALAADRLTELQTIDLLSIPAIIIFTSILFSDERRIGLLIPALIGSSAITWSHWNGRHFRIATHTVLFLVMAVTVRPISAALTKIILQSWDPVTFHLARSGVAAVVFAPLSLGRDSARPTPYPLRFLLMSNLLSTAGLIVLYTSYQRTGIVFTTLVELLQPAVVYVSAVLFLRERQHWRRAAAFVIVLACVALAQLSR